ETADASVAGAGGAAASGGSAGSGGTGGASGGAAGSAGSGGNAGVGGSAGSGGVSGGGAGGGSGSAPVLLASSQNGPEYPTLDATHVYWTNLGSVARVPKSGGAVEILASVGQNNEVIAVDDQF